MSDETQVPQSEVPEAELAQVEESETITVDDAVEAEDQPNR